MMKRVEFGNLFNSALITESLPPPEGEEMITSRPGVFWLEGIGVILDSILVVR